MTRSSFVEPEHADVRIVEMDVTVIFPNQLFWPHPAVEIGRKIFLLEDPLLFGPDERWPTKMHHQKLLLHRASMGAFSKRLEKEGYAVEILGCGPHASTEGMLENGLPDGTRRLYLADPVDDLISRRIDKFAREKNIALEIYESPQFLTPKSFLKDCFGQGQKPVMARFYERQRRRLNILVSEGGVPVGGQWSFDAENRKRLPRGVAVPSSPITRAASNETRPANKSWFPNSRGENSPLLYPITHAEAERWLEEFLKLRLTGFGTYEDAISARHPVLFHSVLTPALNIGLLTPRLVIQRTLEYAADHKVPLNALEGFIRQIIGWREFMRAMYEREGRRMRTSNFWGFSRRMPRAFYEGTTGVEPVDSVIRKVLETGYCHHIERLMVLGNFMLLCRIHPDDVYVWFMEMFVDSYDWVMVPNVYGMSQFADGGGFTTKPYLSGSNYVLKMSNFPRGEWCEIWDALFWTFVADHRGFFHGNPRLSMMARLSDKLHGKLFAHRIVAEKFLLSLS